ncbi:MAG: Hsp33 family molecular chaperone HslO [Myxococcota bacterium]
MDDVCLRARTKDHLELTVALTTTTCRSAQAIHGLGWTSGVAMSRLLTCAGLMAVSSKREGKTSLQILSKARIGRMLVDATHSGELRGMLGNPGLAFPRAGETKRPVIAPALLPGKVSVVRRGAAGDYIQSMTPLVLGEVDRDIEFFIEQSDQVLTGLAADVLLGEQSRIEVAGGLLVQALPDGDPEHLSAIRERVVAGGLIPMLREAPNAEALLREVEPEAELVDEPVPLRWYCPCSRERALNAVRLMGPNELSQMVVKNEPVRVDCDFCTSQYEITVQDLEQLVAETTTAEG